MSKPSEGEQYELNFFWGGLLVITGALFNLISYVTPMIYPPSFPFELVLGNIQLFFSLGLILVLTGIILEIIGGYIIWLLLYQKRIMRYNFGAIGWIGSMLALGGVWIFLTEFHLSSPLNIMLILASIGMVSSLTGMALIRIGQGNQMVR